MEQPNLEGLSLHEEEEGFRFDFDDEGDEQVDLRWCLVGRFLCERAIHFNSMKARMADLWKPVKGVTIKEASTGKFLFHFAHPLDMEAVLNGGPWSFDNNTLIMERVQLGMQIEHIPLHFVHMWVQVHDLPMGLMKERVGIQLANYIGTFLEYDKNNNSSFWRQHMRIRVKIDVRLPLKKDTRVMNKEGKWCTVKFKYEKLGIFCFVCGIMGHAENKCEIRFSMEHDDGVRNWSAEIRADHRRQGGRQTSRWLREEKGARSEAGGSSVASQSGPANSNAGIAATDAELADNIQNPFQNSHTANYSPIITPINTLAHTNSPIITKHHVPVSLIHTDNSISSQPLMTVHTPAKVELMSTCPIPAVTHGHHSPIITNHSNIITNNSLPITIHKPNTETITPHLLSQHIMSFTSQPSTRAPLENKLTIHKLPRGHKNTAVRTGSKPDPSSHQARPDKKPKTYDIFPNPTLNATGSTTQHSNPSDLEAQSEKKRRREEETTAKSITVSEDEHFLTAGPGSQACRDQ
jgi:hypothetical protein